MPGDVSDRVYGLAQRRDQEQGVQPFLKNEKAILRTENSYNHRSAPRAPRIRREHAGREMTAGWLSRERGACQGRAAGFPSWQSPAARPWPTRERSNWTLIQLLCLTNARLALRQRRNAGWDQWDAGSAAVVPMLSF